MAFDPDKYIQKNMPAQAQGFDPDAYLAKPQSKPKVDNSGAAQTSLEQYGNTAGFGYLPHIQAAIEKPMFSLLNLVTGNDVKPDDYIEARDKNIARQDRMAKENPKAAIAGNVAGIGASLLLPAGAASKGATALGRIGNAAKVGALYGAAQNPGDTEGELSPLQLEARGKNAAIGAGTGAILAGGIEGVSKLAEKASPILRGQAVEKAFKTTGANKAQTEAAKSRGMDKVIGETLLDEGAIPVLGTPSKIANNVERLKEEAGQNIGKIIDDVEARQAQYTPIKFTKGGKKVLVKDEVLATPIRFDENPARRLGSFIRAEDAPPTIIRGETQPVERAVYEYTKPQVVAGKVRTVPAKGAEIDIPSVVKSVKNSAEYKDLAGQFGGEKVQAAIDNYLEKLGENGTVGIKGAQKVRQNVDAGINFSKRNADMSPAQEILYKLRTAIRDSMNNAANSVPGAAKDSLLKANRKYSALESASDILDKKIVRDQANRSISLTDSILGAGALSGAMASGGGAGTSALLTGLAAGANKFGRTFGNAIQARGYDAASKGASKLAALTKNANVSPLIPALANAASSRENVKSEEFDPQMLNILAENPDLLESFKDPKIKAKLTEKLNQIRRNHSSK